jgi:hypothetical protein
VARASMSLLWHTTLGHQLSVYAVRKQKGQYRIFDNLASVWSFGCQIKGILLYLVGKYQHFGETSCVCGQAVVTLKT